MKKVLTFIFLLFSFFTYAQTPKYKYKKFEKFDFNKMSVAGDSSSPGDISINPRFRVRFKNKLPEKKSFNTEVLDSLDMIQ